MECDRPMAPLRSLRRLPAALGVLVLLALGGGLAVATTPPERASAPVRGPGSGGSSNPRGAAPAGRVGHARDEGVNPTTPLVVHIAQGTATKVTVTNKASGAAVAGRLAADGSTWTSTAPLAYAAGYAVGRRRHGPGRHGGPPGPRGDHAHPVGAGVPLVHPAAAQDTVGVGQPIVVKFNHPVHDQAAAQRALRSPPTRRKQAAGTGCRTPRCTTGRRPTGRRARRSR